MGFGVLGRVALMHCLAVGKELCRFGLCLWRPCFCSERVTLMTGCWFLELKCYRNGLDISKLIDCGVLKMAMGDKYIGKSVILSLAIGGTCCMCGGKLMSSVSVLISLDFLCARREYFQRHDAGLMVRSLLRLPLPGPTQSKPCFCVPPFQWEMEPSLAIT